MTTSFSQRIFSYSEYWQSYDETKISAIETETTSTSEHFSMTNILEAIQVLKNFFNQHGIMNDVANQVMSLEFKASWIKSKRSQKSLFNYFKKHNKNICY